MMSLPNFPAADAELVAVLALLVAVIATARGVVVILAGITAAGSLMVVLQTRWQAVPVAVVALGLLLYLVVAKLRGSAPSAPAFRWRLAMLAVVVLTAVPLWLFPIPRLPAVDGPFAVGASSVDWVHQFPEGKRRVKVRIWYPAAESGAPIASYLSSREARGTTTAIAQFASMPKWTFSYLTLTQTHGRVDADIAGDGPFPLVLFNHGYWFYTAQNTALMERLASSGYVVVSVAHPGDSMPVAFSDGSMIDTVPYTGKDPLPAQEQFFGGKTHAERLEAYPRFQDAIRDHRILRSLRTWREDLIAVLDDLEAGHAMGMAHKLASRIDFSKVAFVGMSFGGSVSASTCAIDPRCKAAVNMDGFEFDAAMFDRNIDRPLLMLMSDWVDYPIDNRPADPNFHANDYFYERHAEAGTDPDVYRVRMFYLRHLGFTDLPLAVRWPVNSRFVGALDGSQAVSSVDRLVSAFLDRYLRGKTTAFSLDTVKAIPAAQVHDASGVRDAVTLQN